MSKKEDRRRKKLEKKFVRLDEKEKTHPGSCQKPGPLGMHCQLDKDHPEEKCKYLFI